MTQPNRFCYWCAEMKGVDRSLFVTYNLCDCCHEHTLQGYVIVMAYEEKPFLPQQLPMAEGVYPTGEAFGTAWEALRGLLPDTYIDQCKGKAFLSLKSEDYRKLFGFVDDMDDAAEADDVEEEEAIAIEMDKALEDLPTLH
ncbi:hypothetical protein EVB27_112 [Rhizobium phage RHph_TM16]|nr:hypothetical protein EVB27_112 [Rhizobium phage RHph_TM16]